MKLSAESLLSVINDILDFSKIEAGKLDLEAIDFNLRDASATRMKTLALRAHEKGLELAYRRRCRTCPTTWSATRAGCGRSSSTWSATRIKFTEQRRGGRPCVEQESSRAPDRRRRSCISPSRDTGIGIPPDKQTGDLRGVRPGRQLDDAPVRRHRLGLTISSQLVEMMGGRIWVESEVGQGQHVPLHRAVRPASDARERPGRRRAPAELHGLPVLVVDDNATNRRILERHARATGA